MATYGIDLGTTNSCIAYVDEKGRPVVLKSAIGEETTPSVVYFESPGDVVVGGEAKATVMLAPHLVAELVKRQMGEDVHYSFYGQDYTPESISAFIRVSWPARRGNRPGKRSVTWSSPCRRTSGWPVGRRPVRPGRLPG
jgi:molecular chaperone DnaK (HSP70)